jgi:gluconolactonase
MMQLPLPPLPPRMIARPYAVLPPSLHGSGRPGRWIGIERAGAPTPSFLEGPVALSDGSILVSDVAWGRIFRVSDQGRFEVISKYGGAPNGLAVDASGAIWIADYLHGILRLEPASETPEVVLSGPSLEPFKGVNDLCFDDDGRLYFTDQGETGLHDPTGRLYRWDPADGLRLLLGGIPSPNGLCLPGNGDVLLAATRDNAVWRVPFSAHGQPRKVGRFISLSGGTGPDGLALSGTGLLAVAHLGLGVVWVTNLEGEVLVRVESRAGPLVTNVAFGPDDLTLFITEAASGSVLVAELPSDVAARKPDVQD